MSSPPTGILFYEPRAKPLSTTGGIQPGCYYQFYLTSTSTLANVYADGALTSILSQTPGTGQTTAASDGRLIPIYLDPSIKYRVQLYSSGGALLEDTDPFLTTLQLSFPGTPGAAVSGTDTLPAVQSGNLVTVTAAQLATYVQSTIGSSTTLYKYKAAQTSRTNTTTLTDDPDLIFTSVATGTYLIRAFIQFQGPGGAGQGLQWKLNVAGTTSGSTFNQYFGVYNGVGFGGSLATSGINTQLNVNAISAAVQTDYVLMDAVVTTTSTGNISVQWSQRTALANATIINDRSWMSLTKIA